MAKFIDISFDGSDVRVVNLLQLKQKMVVDSVAAKLSSVMTRLQNLIKAKVSGGKVSTGKLADSVTDPVVSTDGANIEASISYGKGVSYAQAVEEGIPGGYVIYPLKKEGTKGFFDSAGRWKTSHGKAAIVRTGKNALRFYSGKLGKEVFADYVFHDPVTGRHYVRDSVSEMREEIINAVREGLAEVLENR